MTDLNIAPPPELIKNWHDEWNKSDQIVHSAYTHIALRAAQWGYDQCYEEILLHAMHTIVAPPYEPDDDDD